MDYIITVVLVLLSAFFSGLNLGLFTIDTQTLKRQASLGNIYAARLYPIRAYGNQLLATLLLGSITVNTTLAIYLGTLLNGVVAGFLATTIIFLFGEIIPQAIFSRHALYVGSVSAPLVYVALFIFSPVAYPIAYILNKLLGDELPKMYSKQELMHIISEHENSEHSTIDADEERIMHGALQFSHRTVREVMTPVENVAMFDENQRLTHSFFEEVAEHGYSRFLVYRGNRSNVVGILFAKDLLVEDENIAIHETEEAFETDFLKVRASTLLDGVLSKMLKQKRHIAVVFSKNNQCVGVISLEDIIEEILQYEIEDEDDALEDGE